MKPIQRRRVRRRRPSRRGGSRNSSLRTFLPRSSAAIAVCFGLAILASAGLYLLLHPVTYRSDAELAVSPRAGGFDAATVISTADSSGAVGTYAEILGALKPDQLGYDNVVAKIRTVPASRAIQIRTESKDKGDVRLALEQMIASVRKSESGIADLWTLETITRPTKAKRASVEVRFIMAGALLAALFGSTALYILLVVLRDPNTYRSKLAEQPRRRRRRPLPPVPPGHPSGR
jgi:hypothetical protein